MQETVFQAQEAYSYNGYRKRHLLTFNSMKNESRMICQIVELNTNEAGSVLKKLNLKTYIYIRSHNYIPIITVTSAVDAKTMVNYSKFKNVFPKYDVSFSLSAYMLLFPLPFMVNKNPVCWWQIVYFPHHAVVLKTTKTIRL